MGIEYQRMIIQDYPHLVPTPEYNMQVQARADAWLFGSGIDYMDYFEEHTDSRVYCFRDPRQAVLFKLIFG